MTKSCFIVAITAVILSGCQTNTQTEKSTSTAAEDKSVMSINSCEMKIGEISFDTEINGIIPNIEVAENGKVSITCTEGKDFFIDPNKGNLSNMSLPMLLKKIDNTKPFTLMAKVTPGFTNEGLYNAATMIVMANDTLWQKLCYEHDDYGKHRVVSVRTQGTSDDNNHDVMDLESIYMKISSDGKTIANYFSTDKSEWHMVRLYENNYPDSIYIGIASQCPIKGECKSVFEELSLTQDNVDDFRMGS